MTTKKETVAMWLAGKGGKGIIPPSEWEHNPLL